MQTKLLTIMAILGQVTYINANAATATTAAVKKAAAPAAAKKTAFSIPDGAELSVELLDKCWNNREDLKNQKIIADYLMTKPAISSEYDVAWKTARLVYFIGNFALM